MFRRIDLKLLLAALLAAALALLGQRQLPAPDRPAPDRPAPPAVPEPAKNPADAIGRLVMVGGYCSATAITPPSADRTQVLLSAAHCVKAVGEVCQFYTRTNRMVRAVVTAVDRNADACLLVTDELSTALPYLPLAEETPAVGAAVMHAGFGRHLPGNVESGRVLQRDTGAGQVMFSLSVSPGDSGGGICLDGSGRVVSPVCCTTQLDGVGQVFGASPEVVRRMMLTPTSFLDVPPVNMPARMPVQIDK